MEIVCELLEADMAQIDIPSVRNFDPHDSKASWTKWVRSFELFAEGRGVTEAKQRKALMLHCAGTAVQDIFYTLELVQGTSGDSEYDITKKTLNRHFESKINVPYERYCFRQLSQELNESMEEFVVRLRQQAAVCEFINVDEQIRDQIIEKCHSNRLRTKLLERGQALTLSELRSTAATFEMTERQSKHMAQDGVAGGRSSVNAIDSRNLKGRRPQSYQGQRAARAADQGQRAARAAQAESNRKCFRCNRVGHFAKDQQCPARGKTCNNCGKTGHFSTCCRSKNAGKEKTENWKFQKKGQTHVRSVEEELHGTDSEDMHAFYVDLNVDACHIDDVDRVKVNVGGVDITMVVDSGTRVNVIDTKLWETLKKNKVKCKSELTDRKLYAYGSSEPLKLKGMFNARISMGSHSLSADFYVLDGEGPALLGKVTAKELGVLKIEVPHDDGVNEINDRSQCFEGIGKLKGYKLHLHVDKSVKPVVQSMYRIPYSLRDKVDAKLDELEALDIIEKVEGPSEWVSPVIVVPKPNGDIRLCVDMRQANGAIRRERHPIPTVDEVLYKMNGGKVFSKLDMKYGYHQIELDEESKGITTFTTHKGLYRYKRLMFGINAAPEMYQNVVSQVLSGCAGVANISDDIVVYGRTKDEHDQRLDKVLETLTKKNLTLNKEKCAFGMDQITFMGHTLSSRGIQPTEDRVRALREAGKPTSSAEVRSFLGLVNFSARYIANLATVAEPLRRLTRKGEPFVWGPEQDESFVKLTECLTADKALGYFRLDADRTQLVTDASNVGLGAVLMQTYNGETRVISYASRTLTDTEKRYSTTEKEALAVVWACQKFHTYLYGVEFQLLTDHKPLEVLYGPKSRPNARIERWVMKLMSYSFKVVYLPGKQNIADILSRVPIQDDGATHGALDKEAEQYVRWVAKEATPRALSTRQVEDASKEDEELSKVRDSLTNDNWGRESVNFSAFKSELTCVGYLILRGTRIVIPKKLRQQCVELAHQGHLGIVGTKQRLRTKVWWPQMERDVEKFVKSCHGCQITATIPAPEPVSPTSLPTGPWQSVGIDLLGPLPSKDYVFVVVDYYSRFYEIDIMKDTTSDRIIESLERMFVQHGLPISITSDNGPQFISEKFEEYLRDNGIEHRKVTPLHPAANGEVERQNRSLMKRIRIAQAENKDWKKEVRQYMFAYRTTPHSVTGKTPAEMMFQRQLRTKLPEFEEKARLDEEARDRDAIEKLKNKQYIDEKRGAKERNDIREGDEVLVRQTKGDKMTTPYNPEPYTLVEKHGNSVVVQSPDGVRYKRNSTHVRKYNRPVTESSDGHEHEGYDTDIQVQTENAQDAANSNTPIARGRPVRETKQPKRFDDFVVFH